MWWARCAGWVRPLSCGILVAAAFGLAPAELVAQGRQGGRGQVAPREVLTPEDIQAQFDAYALVQAQTALRLTDEQYPQFVGRIRTLQSTRRQARMQRNRLLMQLRETLGPRPGGDEARIAAAAKAIDEFDRKTLADIQRDVAAVDEVLTPWQRGRFRLLEDQLEQKKLDMLFRARQGRRR